MAAEDEITALEAFHQVFWPRYPRKRCKYKALKAWVALKLRDNDQKTLDRIMHGLEHDISHEWRTRQAEFIPYAATWLNQRRWEDFE